MPNRRSAQSLKHLLKIYNPPSTPKVGKHTADFIAQLTSAASSSSKQSTSKLTVNELRASVAKSLEGQRMPYPTNISSKSYREAMVGDMRCYIYSGRNSGSAPSLVMFYGGGFCLNTLPAHQSFMANVTSHTNCNIVFPDYPLAPESKAPEVVAKCQQFLTALLKSTNIYDISNDIILLGWSSGSNQALTMALNLANKFPNLFDKISKLILLSPWVDLTMQVTRRGPYQEQQAADKLAAGPDILEQMAKWYLPEGCRGDEPEFCPAFRSKHELSQLPPTTIISGDCEVLLGDGVFLANKLNNADVKVQFIALEGQIHNYMVFNELNRDGIFIPKLIADIVSSKK